MREMMMTTDALVGIGMGQDVFVLTDGRFSGFTRRRGYRPYFA